MEINDSLLTNSDKIAFKLKDLFCNSGYSYYMMSKFEEYDLYAKNKEFLVSENMITFTDTNGKLMALKPDVTLSIVKNSIDLPSEIQKIFYSENVYRISGVTGSFMEMNQTGVECLGNITNRELSDIIALACKSLMLVHEKAVLEISDITLLNDFISKLNISVAASENLLKAIKKKNIPLVSDICDSQNIIPLLKEKLISLMQINGTVKKVIPELDDIFGIFNFESYKSFKYILESLTDSEYAGMIQIDFSLLNDFTYYNGIVMKGFIQGTSNSILSGGQYDRLMNKLGRKSKAIGFAVYTDRIDFEEKSNNSDDFINIALPKGRLGEKVYAMFAEAGFECPSILEQNRKLVFENTEKKVRYFWVKPSDIAVYVERGAADIGVAGKDIILESDAHVYELADLKTGICKMAVAGPKNFKDDLSRPLKVATKFAKIAKDYYLSKGRDIDIVHLNGSIEIAPILGLTDVIVDIVETGTTLKENNLEVIEEICPISARLISNKSAYKFKSKVIEKICKSLTKAVETRND